MPVTVPVSDILSECAFRLQVPAFAAGEFVTADDALRLLRFSCKRLSSLLTGLHGADLFVRTDTLNVQAELDVASLPEDSDTLRTVHWISGDRRIELRRVHPSGEAGYAGYADLDATARGWSEHCPPGYWVEDQVLRFEWAPATAQEVLVSYTGTLSFTDASSELVLGSGWDEWLVCDVCEKIRVREQKDPSDFIRQRADATALITQGATKRDRLTPLRVRDVRPRREGRLDRYGRWPR